MPMLGEVQDEVGDKQEILWTGSSLLRWVVNEFDSFFDAAFQADLARLEKFLLIRVDVAEDVIGLLGTGRLDLLSQWS